MGADLLIASELYFITAVVFMLPWPIFFSRHSLTTTRMIILLFVLDIALTIEAAFYSDIVLIAFLHVITIPALFGLIYVDLVKQHNSYFRCFICSSEIEPQVDVSTIKRTLKGRDISVLVHSNCIRLEDKEKKSISSSVFRRGIPN